MTLLSLDPTKERPEQKVEWEHASESIRIEVDGVSGHYGPRSFHVNSDPVPRAMLTTLRVHLSTTFA